MSESADKAGDSQVYFLLDQVQRLSSLLDHYQKEDQSPALTDSLEGAPNTEEASLLLEKRAILGPLLVEYDKVIEDLKKHNLFYHNELETLSQKIHELTDENTRLYQELDKALRSQIGNNNHVDDGTNSEETISSELVENLKQQLTVVTRERDSYLDKWQASQNGLLRQQKTSQEQSSRLLELNTKNLTVNEELTALKHNFFDLQSYKDTLEVETERSTGFLKRKAKHIETLQGDYDAAKSDMSVMKLKTSQLEKTIEQASQKIRLLEDEKESYIQSDMESEQERSRMKSHMQERAMLLSEQQKEIVALQEQRAELERSLMANSRKLAGFESREEEAVRHVKEGIDMVEGAMIEKNQALMRAQQATSEVARLNETLIQIVEEAGLKTKQAVDEVRMECNQSISNMAREIRSLEDEGQGRAIEFGKVVKEKHNLQKELERVKRGYISQSLETIHQLQQRLSSVELERETAILKMEGVYSDYLQVKEQLEQEQKRIQTDKQNYKQRQESFQSQIECQKEDQLRSNRQVEELKSNLKESHLDLETCERKNTLKIQSLTKQFKAKEAEQQARFDGTESSHREATSELRNLLSSHQRLGAKWKGETKTITEKFENATKKLKEENSKLKRGNEELKSEVIHSRLEQHSVVSKLRNLESLRDNFQDRVDELEDRNDQYSQQLTKYMTKERQWEQEQKILSNHLTRLQIQSSHSKMKSKGSRIMTAPSDKLKSDFITSANLPPPIFSSTSSINKAIQSPNILSEPFLHFDTYSNGDSTLSIQTND